MSRFNKSFTSWSRGIPLLCAFSRRNDLDASLLEIDRNMENRVRAGIVLAPFGVAEIVFPLHIVVLIHRDSLYVAFSASVAFLAEIMRTVALAGSVSVQR